MAKMRVGNAVPEWVWFEDFYDEASLKLDTHSKSKAVYEDKNGFDIVLSGKNLDFSGKNIKSGQVESVQFLDDHGKTLISVTGGDYNAHKLSEALLKHGSLWEFMTLLTAGDDKIYGSKVGFDLDFGLNDGNDLIVAGSGGSNIEGSKGNDTMKGGAGWDSISFGDTDWRSDDKHGIKLDAAKGTIFDSWGDKDKFDNKFEEYQGSVYADVLKGSKRDEAFMGLKGKDIIDGGGGWDEVRYHRDQRYNGDDGIVANLVTGKVRDGFGNIDSVKNIEAVYGTYFDDKFTGDKHDNQFRGLSGVDSFDGGKGTDQVNFDWWENLGQHGVDVDLTLTTGQIKDDGFGNVETTKGIEALGGSNFADKLKLGADGGWAWGGDGKDVLTAGIAGDWLGGAGGNDTFVFLSAAAIGTRTGKHCWVDDFSEGHDQLDLSAISGLSFIGDDAFGNVAGELRFQKFANHTFVLGDTDGDGTADFALELNGAVDLKAGDLVL